MWYDLNVKCPICKEGFTLDDKVATFECSPMHWYHRSCMYKHVNETKDITCGYCGDNAGDWRQGYVFPDDEEAKPAEEAPAEEPADGEEAPAEGDEAPAE